MSSRSSHIGLLGAIRPPRGTLLCLSLTIIGCQSAGPRDVARETPRTAQVQAQPAAPIDPNKGCGLAVAQRTSDAGCWLTVQTALGVLNDAPLFWHVYSYASATDANAARSPRGTTAEAFGKHWLFAIEPQGWKPASGERLAVVGPLNVKGDVSYTARYMEAVFPAGYTTPLVGHRHSGAEAWYILTGAQCLETPTGPMVLRAGESGMVPQGPPMSISVVGPDTRRAVLLVLHPTAEPWVSSAADWTPKGICPK